MLKENYQWLVQNRKKIWTICVFIVFVFSVYMTIACIKFDVIVFKTREMPEEFKDLEKEDQATMAGAVQVLIFFFLALDFICGDYLVRSYLKYKQESENLFGKRLKDIPRENIAKEEKI